MPILSSEQREIIVRRLDFLRLEVSDIPCFVGMTQAEYLENRDRRRSLERLAENVVNCSIDVAKILLSSRDLPIPDTYRDVVLQMGIAGFVDTAVAERLAEMTRLRNILAHQYLDIRWAGLCSFIEDAPMVMKEFTQSLERLLESSCDSPA